MKTSKFYLITLCLSLVVVLFACTDESELDSKSGTLTLKITDAASDDEDIDKIFITVKEVRLNDKPVRGFEPQTIEISSLVNGKTELLLRKELPAKEKNKLTLVLGSDDGSGMGTSGSYVLTKDKTQHNLFKTGISEIEITLPKEFEMGAGDETVLIADFNLRKAIVYDESDNNSYRFVTDSELQKAVRLVHEDKVGKIYGTVDSWILYDHDIYVLVYKSGEFNPSEEGTGTGTSKIMFANSVSMSRMNTDGTYELPFLEEGKYDIRLAGFRKTLSNEYVFMGFLPTTSRRTGMVINNIDVAPNSNIELNLEIFRFF